VSGEGIHSSVVKPQPSSWKAVRTIGVFVVAGLMTGCASSIKNDLRHMPEWARYVDAVIWVVAGSLFFLAGSGMIRHRREVAELFLSFPGARILLWYWDPNHYYLFQSVMGGLFAVVCGVVCVGAAFAVLAQVGSG